MLVRKRENSETDISHMGPYPVKGDLKENGQGPRDISPENAREGLSPVGASYAHQGPLPTQDHSLWSLGEWPPFSSLPQ